jgi:class 3 adenylate cyclase/predicted ATPase
MLDVARWLAEQGLEQYAEAFAANAIDGDVLRTLTGDDLKELGVVALGHRKRLLEAIAALRDESASASPPPSRQPQAAPSGVVERRQLTVMFVDLVGSTELARRLDPEELGGIMRAYQNAVTGEVAHFEGHVAKFMGDGVLAYFGWPRAHEDEAERAVRAGLAILEAIARLAAPEPLRARIGVATGLVMVGELVGEGPAREEAVVGETPNLAARLQALAEPNSVVISRRTRLLVDGLFELADLGAQELKGFVEPVQAWRVLGPSITAGRFEARHAAGVSPLVGREHELALLLDRWQQAKEGEGQVVLLSGEPGIGKSRLVRALRERLGDEPYTPLSHFCSPFHQTSVLHPVIDLLERTAGYVQDEPPERKLDKLEALLGRGAMEVAAAAPLIAALLLVPAGDRYPPLNLTPQRQKDETLGALLAQLAGLAAERPVLAVYEDVHWADPSTLELLEQVIKRVQRLPVLVLITCRLEFKPPWHAQTHLTSLTLNRLSRKRGTAMVAELTGGKALPPEVLVQILQKTDGVPLFVEELTKTVLESGLLSDAGMRYELAGPLPPLAIPATLQDSLMARLDRLVPVKEVAQVAACIGREFGYELLAAVAPLDEAELQDALRQLAEAGLVFGQGVPPQASYVFKHALVRDAAYESLLKSKRQALHARIVGALQRMFHETAEMQPELVAQHCEEAGLAAKAIEYWHQAGQLATQRLALAEAMAQLWRGLKLLPRLSDRVEQVRLEIELQVTLGHVLMALKGVAAPEMGAAYGRARALCRELGEARLEPVALWGVWQYLLNHPDMVGALETAEEMLAWAKAHGDVVAEVAGHRSASVTRLFRGDFELALAHADRVSALYDPAQHSISIIPTDPWIATRSLSVWTQLLLGRPERALALSREVLTAADADAHPYIRAVVWHQQNVFDQIRGERLALEERSAGLAVLTEKHGFQHWHATATILHGWAVAAGGAPEAGLEEMRRGLAAKQATGAEIKVPYYLGLMAGLLGQSGLAGDALALVDDALARVEATGERWFKAELHRLRGTLLLVLPEPDREGAEACFRHALAVAREQGAKMWELRAARSLARLWGDQGRRSDARDLLAPIYGWFTEGFDTPDLIEAKELLDAL